MATPVRVPGGPVDEYTGVVEHLRVFGHAGFFSPVI